jgi:hypothetical protein
MTTGKENIKKAQQRWQEMTPEERALAQPEGRNRQKPGTTGEGEYYHIVVRPKGSFTTFRYQDVGDPGHILRHAGQRKSGSWDTHAWLISKEDAHVVDNKIVADTEDARKLLATLGSEPTLVKGDIFEAKDRPDIPESEKPTAAQRNAWKAKKKLRNR